LAQFLLENPTFFGPWIQLTQQSLWERLYSALPKRSNVWLIGVIGGVHLVA
jgi:hypothetical protein